MLIMIEVNACDLSWSVVAWGAGTWACDAGYVEQRILLIGQ